MRNWICCNCPQVRASPAFNPSMRKSIQFGPQARWPERDNGLRIVRGADIGRNNFADLRRNARRMFTHKVAVDMACEERARGAAGRRGRNRPTKTTAI